MTAAAGNALAGLRIVVSAGPTFEDIDPVRFIGNRSSGKMGFAVAAAAARRGADVVRSEEHTSELQSLMRISYAVFCLKKKKKPKHATYTTDVQYSRRHNIKPTHTTKSNAAR